MEAGDQYLRADALPVGTLISPQWRVVEQLGVGGQGAVYRVEDTLHPGDFYALKLALYANDERAAREAELLLHKAAHPNVARFYGCVRWPDMKNGHLGSLLEWVDGLPLHQWAETVNPSFRRFAAVAGKVALVLGDLHARGLLHRDLKPEHILIRHSDEEPVMVDLATGWYEGADTLTSGPLPPGTLHLRSPESMRFLWKHGTKSRAEHHSTRAEDLYALGVCLYRCVTGHYPFPPGISSDLLMHEIAFQKPYAPTKLNPRVPRTLDKFLLRLLEKEPEARYASGEEVQQALVAAVSFSEPKEWEQPLFEWEEAPAREGEEKPQRRIRRPRFPDPPKVEPRKSGVSLLPGRRAARGRPRPVEPPGPEAQPELPLWRQLPLPLWGMGLGILLALGLLGLGPWAWQEPQRGEWQPEPSATVEPTSPPPPPRREVAQAPEAPEAGRAAAPLPSESTPAAAAPEVATPSEKPPMRKKPQPQDSRKPSLPPPPQAKGESSTALGTAVACVGLACSSAQVLPPPEDCPPESRATMKSLGIGWGQGINVVLDPEQGTQGMIKVRSGPIHSPLVGKLGKLPEGTVLSGHLYAEGERVYARYDRARTPRPREETYPVCFVVGDYGITKQPDSQPGAVLVPPIVPAVAVKRFEFKPKPPLPWEDE
jgi:serine/threonine-protein kinase